jgi:hypothetical protein
MGTWGFVATPSSRIKACFSIFIMWFIFNPQRKNKQLELVVKKYTYIEQISISM